MLHEGGYFGRYLPTSNQTGELVYIHQGTLMGLPFNLSKLESQGVPVPLLEDVAGDAAAEDLDRTVTRLLVGGQFGHRCSFRRRTGRRCRRATPVRAG